MFTYSLCPCDIGSHMDPLSRFIPIACMDISTVQYFTRLHYLFASLLIITHSIIMYCVYHKMCCIVGVAYYLELSANPHQLR